MSTKLTGDELLEFVKSNPQMDAQQQMHEAGYTKERNGQISYLKTAFYKAISEGQGVVLAKTPYKPPTRKLNYMVKASNRGVIPLSQCYASKVGIGPGDYCKVEIEDDLLILTRVNGDDDNQEPETACPMPQPEACGI